MMPLASMTSNDDTVIRVAAPVKDAGVVIEPRHDAILLQLGFDLGAIDEHAMNYLGHQLQ